MKKYNEEEVLKLIEPMIQEEMNSRHHPTIISISAIAKRILKKLKLPLYANQEKIVRTFSKWWHNLPNYHKGGGEYGKILFGYNVHLGSTMSNPFCAILHNPEGDIVWENHHFHGLITFYEKMGK